MDKLYRVFTWVIQSFLTLLVMPLFRFLPLRHRDHLILLLPVYLGLLFCGGKYLLKKDTVVEPKRISRIQSSLIWIAILLDGYAVFHWLCFKYGILLYCFGIRSSYLLIPFMVLVAVFAVIFRPFSKHSRGLNLGISGIVSGALIIRFICPFADRNYAYRGKHLPIGYVMEEKAQRAFFPDNSSEFEIKGLSGFFTVFVEWNCKVPEKDFEEFRRKNGYRFVLNRTDVNEDKSVGPLGNWYSSRDWRKPYFFHNNIHANGGGLTLLYSVPEQKLYGRYANR